MSASDVKPGDEVAWNWGSGGPAGVAKEVKEDEVKMDTKRGNTVTKKGEEGNPAVYVERSGHDVVKKASELEVESQGPNHKGGEGQSKTDGDAKKDTLEVPGEKKGKGRPKSKSPAPPVDKKSKSPAPPAEKKDKSAEPEKKSEEKPAAKKDGEEKKKPGRKPGSKAGATKKADKPKKRAATETGEPRRSKRNKT